MKKNVWLHIGSSTRTLMVPATSFRGMHPSAAGTLMMSFDSIVNAINSPADKVDLNLFENNTHLDVMKSISRAMHNHTPTFDGFITIADDSTSSGGGYAAGFFHTPEYVTDGNADEGKVVSINSLIVQDPTNGSLTATTAAAWANGTETPRAGWWNLSSSNAAHVVHLPPCHAGARVEYICSGSGFKLRAEVSTDKINNVNGEEEVSIPADTERIIAIGISATEWLVEIYDSLGYLYTVGNGFVAPDIYSSGNDINITATNGSVNVTATEDAADAITLTASAGGIDISATGESGQDIDIRNIGGSVHLYSTEDTANAISLTTTVGGIDITASGAAAGEDIDIVATGSSVNITSTESIADAVTINASNGGIQLTGDASSIETTTTKISALQDLLYTLPTPITSLSGATVANGYEYIVNDADGGALVLPALTAANMGIRIRVIIGTTITSNTITITAAAGDLLKGYAIMERIDNAVDNAKTLIQPDGTDDVILTLNGTDQGGLVGDIIDFTSISATEWRVRAHLQHTSTAADPFS